VPISPHALFLEVVGWRPFCELFGKYLVWAFDRLDMLQYSAYTKFDPLLVVRVGHLQGCLGRLVCFVILLNLVG